MLSMGRIVRCGVSCEDSILDGVKESFKFNYAYKVDQTRKIIIPILPTHSINDCNRETLISADWLVVQKFYSPFWNRLKGLPALSGVPFVCLV